MKSSPQSHFRPAGLIVGLLAFAGLMASFSLTALMQQQGGNFTLHPSVIPGGGGASANGPTSLAGTIGQGVLGSSTGGSFSLVAGFWQASSPCAAPLITSQPSSQTACERASTSLSVSATGAGLTYQWRKNSTNLTGATSETLTLNNVGAGDAGLYDCVISNPCGASVTSNAATLTVSTYSLSLPGQSFPSAGGNSSLNVLVGGACGWTAVSNSGWITITGGAAGSGNGAVNYTVGANTGGARTGRMTIAGFTFTVIQAAPTAVTLISLSASAYEDGVFIEWQTGLEVENLGFNLYRDDAGKLARVNQQLLAGSALKFGQAVTLGAGYSYSWWDNSPPSKVSQYWLEDVDLSGRSTWHGPVVAIQVEGKGHPSRVQQSRVLASLAGTETPSRPLAPIAELTRPNESALNVQHEIASRPAVKIAIKQTGFYRLTQQDLVNAGLDFEIDPRLLQLFVDGKQQSISVTGEEDGRLDSMDSVEFYGVAADSPFTDSRIYWLVAGKEQGLRIARVPAAAKPNPGGSFGCTIERRDRTIYFSALRNGDSENFFGAALATQPLDQRLVVKHLDTSTNLDATLELAMQGVTEVSHQLVVQFNGSNIGFASYQGQTHSVNVFRVPWSLLREGENTVALGTTGSPSDVSLVDYIRLSYQRSYAADGDVLRFTAEAQKQITIGGFSDDLIRVFDVTDTDAVAELSGYVAREGASYAISLQAPGVGPRSLLALTKQQFERATRITADNKSKWRSPSNGADFVIITHGDLVEAGRTLQRARQAQGLSVALVDIEDVYDEFSYGQKTPYAVRDFLAYVSTNWKKRSRFALLLGDSSYDSKNYLGPGDFDLVPSRLIDTTFLEAPSDDWFTDFNGDGTADFAIGRLPARTAEEAETMITKIIAYDRAAPPDETLLVADRNDGIDFEGAIDRLADLVPTGVRVVQLKRGQMDENAAKSALFDAINRGQRMVSYHGHGSVDNWRGNLLSSNNAALLVNKDRLPVFVMMSCLNGYFNDVVVESLSESLIKAQGGAVAVWASSSMTYPTGQELMNQELYRLLLADRDLTLGEAVIRAKAATLDLDVRRTWVLFGDPTMRLK